MLRDARFRRGAAAEHARGGALQRDELAHARADYARMRIGRGGPGDAEAAWTLIADAVVAADELAMEPLRERLAALRQRAAALRGPAGDRSATRAVFRRVAGERIVKYGDRSLRLKDSKGLCLLAVLLASPGQEIHVVDLAHRVDDGDDSSATAAARGSRASASARPDGGDAALDATARAAYQERLRDLELERDEARRFNDPGRESRALHEIELLTSELARRAGAGGDRHALSQVERVRQNVSRSISAALRTIAAASPELGEHLAASVRTGLFCSYAPDPRVAIDWSF